MACIYFTARQPVDFSFLHYASPSLSIFFSLLPSLDAFPPRFSSLSPPSLPSFRCPSFFDFSFSSFTRLLAPFAVLFPLSRPFSSRRPSRSFGSSSFRTREWATHRGDDEKKSTQRGENRRSNERIRYCAHIERELPRTGQTWEVRIEKDTTPLARDKSRNGEGSRMRRSVESCCQAGYKFQVKF